MIRSNAVVGGLALLGILSLTAAIYWPGINSDFILDDYQNIVDNGDIRIDRISVGNLIEASRAYGGGLIGRPISTITFAINYELTGLDPRAFNLTNLAIHLLNATLVLLLLQALFRLAGIYHRPEIWALALAGTLYWSIHPIQVSTVLYAVQRMEMLSATFTLAALLSYIHGRRVQIRGQEGGWAWLIMAGALAALAFASKENGILVPFYALAIEIFLLHFRAKNKLDARFLIIGFLSFFIAALLGYLLWALPGAFEPSRFMARDFTPVERVLSQFRVLPMYLGLMAWPAPDRLLFYYDHLTPSTGLFRPVGTFFGLLFLIALAALMVLIRRRWPLVALGIAWLFIGHLITSNVFSLELAFEHRNYLPLLGFVIALTGAISHALAYRPLSRFLPWFGTAVLATLAIATLLLTSIWGDHNRLAVHHAAINPDSERAVLELGFAYLDASDNDPSSPWHQEAVKAFELAATKPQSTPVPEQNLIVLASKAGVPAKDEWWQSFQEKLRNQPVGAGYRTAVQNLLRNRFRGANIDDTQLEQAYRTLLQRNGIQPRIHAEFGFYFLEVTDEAALAYTAFTRALDLLADDQTAQESLIRSLIARGHGEFADRLQLQNQPHSTAPIL